MKRILVAIILALFLINISSQRAKAQYSGPYIIYGEVINKQNRQPIPFASIVVVSTGQGTMSGEDGSFKIVVPSDTSTIQISCLGFLSKKKKLWSGSPNVKQSIKLKPKDQQLDEVTVISEKERIVRITDNISSVKISPKLIAKLPNMGEVDIMRSFQLLPGISGSNETSAGLYVRGGTPDQNLILFDGMSIYHVDHFYGFFSAFNANTIDDIELYKGGFPASFGGRTSSVMDITGKPADLTQSSGGGSISLLSANLHLELPIVKDKVSLQFAVRRSYTDLIRTGLYNKIFDLYEDDNTEETNNTTRRINQTAQQPKFHFYDINSKLTYQVNDKNTLAASFYNGKDKLDNFSESSGFSRFDASSGSGDNIDKADWGNIGSSVQWKSEWSKTFTSNLFMSYSNYFNKRDIEAGSGRINSYDDNNVEDISFRYRNYWTPNKQNTIEFGIEHTYNDIAYQRIVDDTLNLIDKKNQGAYTSLYLQDKYSISEGLDVTLGGRATYYDVTEKLYFEPRISAIYEPYNKLRFKAAWGKYHQFISRTIREDVLQGSTDFWLLSDGESIPVSSAIHYIAGIDFEKDKFYYSIEAFYKDMDGLTEYSERSSVNPREISAQEGSFYSGTGYAQGIEFLIQKKYGRNTGWIAYTLSEVKNTFPDLNYGKSYNALHDQTHELKAVYTRKLGNWDFSAAFIYATGKPYSAPESQYQIELLDGSESTYVHVGDKNAYRLPDYHKLDVSAAYNWLGKNTENTLAFSFFNVYNRTNVWYKKFEIEDGEMFVTDVNLLGFTPNVSYTLKF